MRKHVLCSIKYIRSYYEHVLLFIIEIAYGSIKIIRNAAIQSSGS